MKLIILIRSIISTVLFTVGTLSFATIGILLNFIFNRRDIDNAVIENWGRFSCFIFNVEVKAVGLENYPNDEGGVVLFNHSSFMDILAMVIVLKNMRFGAKIELFKIPIFGYCMRRLGNLPIARNSREEVFRVYEMAQGEFKKSHKFALAPEGGRFHGEQLKSFKSGPFVFAINAHVQLLPVVIKGAYKAWPKGSMIGNPLKWKSSIEVHVLPALSTTEYTLEQRQELQKKAFQIMNEYYLKLDS